MTQRTRLVLGAVGVVAAVLVGYYVITVYQVWRAARHDGWIGAGNDPAEVPGIVAGLQSLRREAGASGEFEIIAALNAAPDLGVFRRMEDAGVTGLVSYPLLYTIGPGATLDQKRKALEAWGETFIAGYR